MTLCLVRGCGDIGSAVAHALFSAGHAVVIHDVAAPGFARRGMAFTDAMFDGSAVLQGLTGRRTGDVFSVRWMLEQRQEVPLVAVDFRKLLDYLRPHVLIDARMNKRSVPERQRNERINFESTARRRFLRFTCLRYLPKIGSI